MAASDDVTISFAVIVGLSTANARQLQRYPRNEDNFPKDDRLIEDKAEIWSNNVPTKTFPDHSTCKCSCWQMSSNICREVFRSGASCSQNRNVANEHNTLFSNCSVEMTNMPALRAASRRSADAKLCLDINHVP